MGNRKQDHLQVMKVGAQLSQAALSGADLVLHTAGPFQRKNSQLVLETAIAMGVPYVDVCDDAEYAQACKRLHQRAVDAKVPAITTAGIYPGEQCKAGTLRTAAQHLQISLAYRPLHPGLIF